MSISTLECVPGIETSFKFLDRVKRCVCAGKHLEYTPDNLGAFLP